MTSNLDFNLHVYQQVKIMFAEFFHSFTEIMSIRLPLRRSKSFGGRGTAAVPLPPKLLDLLNGPNFWCNNFDK